MSFITSLAFQIFSIFWGRGAVERRTGYEASSLLDILSVDSEGYPNFNHNSISNFYPNSRGIILLSMEYTIYIYIYIYSYTDTIFIYINVYLYIHIFTQNYVQSNSI